MKTVRRLLSKNEPPSSWQVKRAEVLRRKYGYGNFEGNGNLVMALLLASTALISCIEMWFKTIHK